MALLVLVVAGCRTPPAPVDGRATVVRVVDGDTVVVDVGPSRETVRLIGIDTPETKAPDRPVGCYGPEASARLGQLLPPGGTVVLQRDREARDRYGRLLAYVTRADDGLFVNAAMAREGYARLLVIAPNRARTAEVSAAVAEARRAGRGLWGACPAEG